MGGSTTLNRSAYKTAGIDYAGTLERLLNAGQSEKTYEVLNAGSAAFSSAHSLINITFRLSDYNPDAIILMNNINDLSVNYYGSRAQSDYSNKYMKSYFVNPQLQSFQSLRGALNQSRQIAGLGLDRAFQAGELNTRNDISEGIAYFRRNLLSIVDFCKRHGITLILLTQPSRMSDFQTYNKADFLAYNEQIRQIHVEENVSLIDMFKYMGHDKKLFIDEFHYTPDGVRKFSSIMYVNIKPILH